MPLMMNAYHGETKPWAIKAVSLFVIFAFLMTQSDMQLAFAYNAAARLPPAANLPVNSDKIHYMQDFQNLKDQTAENPVNEVRPGEQKNPLTAPSEVTPESDVTSAFLNGGSPLLSGRASKDLTKVTVDGKTTYSDTDGTAFKVDDLTGRILMIRDKTRPVYDQDGKVTGYELEDREFVYGTTAVANGSVPAGTDYIRVITVGKTVGGVKALDTYQKFTVSADGSLNELFESGYVMENGNDAVIRCYDPETNRVTVTGSGTDADGFYITESVYEQLAGATDRLVSYEKVYANAVAVSLEIRYDDAAGKMTVIDRLNDDAGMIHFWEYTLLPGNERGDLLASGDMDPAKNDAVTSRVDIGATTYTITNPQDSTQLVVFERLSEGGFGRILRYKMGGAENVDLFSGDGGARLLR
ncbi:MAG TPA: hypothetical protein PLL75_07835, partial [Candidatus Omnitrophota bacterium]|nr:hypothetical protein [Candidatus Omnitrophota bacterium]